MCPRPILLLMTCLILLTAQEKVGRTVEGDLITGASLIGEVLHQGPESAVAIRSA